MSARESSQAASDLCTSPLWRKSLWIATTYRWHPTGEAPPVMGIVFADQVAGIELFRSWTGEFGHNDIHDDLRIAIIEGDIPDQAPGYSIRFSSAKADWESVETGNESPSQVQRVHPLPNNPDMLQEFKREYLKHFEFLLAPVVCQDDGQVYFAHDEGIVKTECVFCDVGDIGPDEPDAIVFRPPPQLPDVIDM